MGFLDRQSRVVDIVLTVRGRKLYAAGELDFAYFGLFDDMVDYDPWSTGSLGDDDRERLVASSLVLEAPIVRDVRYTVAPLEPTTHLFTAGGFDPIPHMTHPSGSLAVSADQRRDSDGSYRRSATSVAQITMDVEGETVGDQPGFIFRVFASGSDGLQELDLRRDSSGRRAYDPFVAVAVDSETILDRPLVVSPQTVRAPSTAKIGFKK